MKTVSIQDLIETIQTECNCGERAIEDLNQRDIRIDRIKHLEDRISHSENETLFCERIKTYE